MIVWQREVMAPLHDKSDDKNLVNKLLKTFNKFLLSDINKICGVDLRSNVKIANTERDVLEIVDSDISLFAENSDFSKVYSNASTLCSSLDGTQTSHTILSNKNIYDEMNSFEFQAQYFIEQ